jgi:hypothetical protein
MAQRSHQSNARYWLLIHQIADHVRPNGKEFSAESWHCYMKQRFLGCDEMRLPNGKVLLNPKSTADLDSDAFSEYQMKVEAWGNDHGVWLADIESAA